MSHWPTPTRAADRLPPVRMEVLGYEPCTRGWRPATWLGDQLGWYVRGYTGQIISHWVPMPDKPEDA